MISSKQLAYVWRALFASLLLISLVLAWQIIPQIKIDTDLADVTPKTRNTKETQAAITELRSSIEQRVILLIQGDDEDEVIDAEDALRVQLSKLDDITVFDANHALLEELVSGLFEYRFSLLSSEQRQDLVSKSTQEIAQAAQSNLYKNSNNVQFFAFDKDPLGWHSKTFSDLLNSSQSGIIERQSETGFAESISLKINRGAMNMDTQAHLSMQLAELINSTENNHAVKVDKSGVFFFAAAAADQAKADIRLISIGSGLGVILLLMVAFRSMRALVLPMVSIALGVAFAFLLTHTTYGQVHILTLVFGASLIGIVIDYSLHYFYHRSGGHDSVVAEKALSPDTNTFGFNNRVKDHDSADQKAQQSALQRALLLSLTTSLIGYGALSFSSLEALQKVAFFSCCGLVMAWLSVVCLGEWATAKNVNVNQRIFPLLVAKFMGLIKLVPSRYWFSVAISIIMIAGLMLKFIAPFNDDPRVFFTPAPELMASESRVAAATNDYEPGRYVIIHGETRAQVYDRYRQLMRSVVNSPVLDPDNLSSLLSWIPDPQQQRLDYQQYAKLYSIGGAVDLFAQSLRINSSTIDAVRSEYQGAVQKILQPEIFSSIIGQALPPFWIESNVGSSEQMFINFVLIRKGIEANQLNALSRNLDGVEYVNTLQRTEFALAEQRGSAIAMLLIAYALIAALVLLRYRKLSALWMITVPLCASAGFMLCCVLIGVSLNLFHIMALFLVLGFGMDYTIFTKEMRGQSKMQKELSLQAILLSALTSLLSFGLLGFSSMPVVASFGLTLLIGNVFNLFGVFVAARMLDSNKLQQAN